MVKFQGLCRYERDFWLGGQGWSETILEAPSKTATHHNVLAAAQLSPGSINIGPAFEKTV